MAEKLLPSQEQQPEEKQESERTSGIMRLPGVSSEEEKEKLGIVESELFNKQDFFNQEREKTPDESEIINGILARLPEFVRKYGGKPVPLRSEHIHVIDIDKLNDEQKKNIKDMSGRYFFGSQRAAVLVDPQNDTKLNFAERSVHEKSLWICNYD